MDTKPTIVLTVDSGLSKVKAVWRDPEGFAHLMEMGPELKELRESDLSDSGLSKGRPLQDAWVTIAEGGSSRDTTTIALGFKAQQLQGRPPFKESKYGPAVYKIAAIVGAIAQELGVTTMSLCLGTLLPYVEYRDRQRFESLITECLKNFSFRGTQIRCDLQDLFITPEGAGIAETYAVDHEEAFLGENTFILILGHRDISLLPYRKGTYVEQPGAKIGFSFFVDDVLQSSSLNLDESGKALATSYIYKSKWDESCLERLASLAVRNRREIKHKTDEIGRSIEQAKYRYLSSLMEHLNDINAFLQEADRVIVSGGPTPYWIDDLKEYFGDYPNLDNKPLVYEQIHHRIELLLGPQEEAQYHRLGDVVGLFERLAYDAQLKIQPHSKKVTTSEMKPPAQGAEAAEAVGNGHSTPVLPELGAPTTGRKPKK